MPGSGKTTLAQWLVRRLGCAYLRIDTIEPADAGDIRRLAEIDGAADKSPLRSSVDDFYFTTPTSLKYFITPGWISAAFGAAATVFAAVVSHACGSFLHSAASAPCSVRASR